MSKPRIWPFFLLALLLTGAALLGALLGKGLAMTFNTIHTENFTEIENDLPTRLLDINGEVITEYAGENREIIAFSRLPQEIIDALLTREDRIYYEHPGFSIKALVRAVLGQVLHRGLGGGSTLTQQIAGTLYCDRTDKSVKRKLWELWWAIQMERRYSKNEILELYLNKIYFGVGTTGVNAACKYYFGHDATSITYAEAAILVIQLSNPALMNPFDYPNRAMNRQKFVLDGMVEAGYLTQEEAEESFDAYWAEFDVTRTNQAASRADRAPWFSEYVRRQLADMMYGEDDIYTGGFTVNTTLDLNHQRDAEEIMADYIAYGNRVYQRSMNDNRKSVFRSYVPFTELMTLVFNLPGLKMSDERVRVQSMSEYSADVNPLIDLVAMMSGIDTLKTDFVNKGNALLRQQEERTTVEGTMISVENGTGYINALVGGSQYDAANQFIRAVQARVQPGSSFKPLYYSAAIDSRKFTMASVVNDSPQVFHNADGSPYIPLNYVGHWYGDVLLSTSLALSLNVPSVYILQEIGLDAAIDRSASLLGIPVEEQASRAFDPVLPLGLGVCSVRPIEMAKAYATFANNGREVTPISIRTIEDRNGTIIANPEKQVRDRQAAKGADIQIISEQNAFIMQEMMKRTVAAGTLASASNFASTKSKIGKDKGKGYKFRFYNTNGQAFNMPVAGKTGTTQNWADAWAVGSTAYYTSVFWFGFDRPGQSLGQQLTGATLAAPAWGDFMHDIHVGKPYKDFFAERPEGIVQASVCRDTGMLHTPDCGSPLTAYFLAGTEPTETCTKHQNNMAQTVAMARLELEEMRSGFSTMTFTDDGLALPDLSFLNSDAPVGEDGTDDGDPFGSIFMQLDIFGPEEDGEEGGDGFLQTVPTDEELFAEDADWRLLD